MSAKRNDVQSPFIPPERLRQMLAAMQAHRENCRMTAAAAPYRKLAQSATGKRPGAEALITGLGLHLKDDDRITLNGSFDAAELAEMKRAGEILLAPEPAAKPARAAWQELQKLAAAKRLPVIFLSLDEAEAPGKIPMIAVDGNDAVAVYRVAQESIAHARGGSGPTLISARIGAWEPNPADPLGHMEEYLAARGLAAV